MHIINEYTPTAKTLARVGVIFLDKQPLVTLMLWVINLMTALAFLIILAKWAIVLKVTWQELVVFLFAGLWIFGRKKINLWLLERRMQNNPVLLSPIKIELSLNGITWSGQKLKRGSLAWDNIKWIMQVQNGYIIPMNFARFLWLPNQSFANPGDAQTLMQFIQEKHIPLRVFDKWQC